MSPAKKLYQQHLAQLPIETQLELLEIIIQKALKKFKSKNDELGQAKESGLPDSVKPVEVKPKKQAKKGGAENSPQEKELTELQKILLTGPVMSEEDYQFYLQKRAEEKVSQNRELTELQKMMLKVPVMSEEDYELYLAKRANKWR